VLDVVLTREEDVVSYWDLPVRLWRYNLTLVVADGVKALDTAISRSGVQVVRQTCPVHLKRSRRVRGALDLLLSRHPHPGLSPPLLPPCPQGALAPPQVQRPDQPFNSLPESSASATPPEDRIAWSLAINYNLSTYYLIIVIILQDSLFLREMVKYIQ